MSNRPAPVSRQRGFLLSIELAFWLPLIMGLILTALEFLRVLLMMAVLDYSLTQAAHYERMGTDRLTATMVEQEMLKRLEPIRTMSLAGSLQVSGRLLSSRSPVAVAGLTRNEGRLLLITASYTFQSIYFRDVRLPVVDWTRSVLVQMEPPPDAP